MKVLIVDEDLKSYELTQRSPLVEDCDLINSSDPDEIQAYAREYDTDVVLIDIDRPGFEGTELVKQFQKDDALIEVVLSGKELPREKVLELINAGASEYLAKPFLADDLHQTFKKVQNKKKLRRDTFRLEKRLEKKYLFQGIVGKSPYMLEIFSLIEKIAQYFSSILVTGETGTGKEMIASAIHAVNRPRNRKLVICDCVSIPDTLFESELFGYVKGAFTGADKTKKGLFEEAHQGIIFFDEIGEIPLSVQAKLLRALEYHQYRPLGSTEVKKVDVRVIAATNRDLKDSIAQNTFREDLYHRLNKVRIHLPALREKREDIPLLVRYFLESFNRKFDKSVNGISQQVQKLFQKYDWPGNIRELENVLERAMMLCERDFIDLEDLPDDLKSTYTSENQIPFINRNNLSSLEDLEKDYIAYLLKFTNNNMRRTSKILGISRTTLYNKLAKLNIPR